MTQVSALNNQVLHAKLMDMLVKYNSKKVSKLCERYVSFPHGDDEEKCIKGHPDCLGAGAFGRVVRCKRAGAGPNDAPVVVKVQQIAGIKSTGDVQHLMAEIAISGIVDHKNLNKRLDLLHSHDKIFTVIELVGAPAPDVLTRLASVYAQNAPKRLPEIDILLPRWKQAAKEAGVVDPENEEAFAAFVDKNKLIQGVALQLGSPKPYEIPVSGTVFDLICDMRYVPDPMLKSIMRQFLEGLEYLHSFGIVHRDLKPENCCFQTYRIAKIKREGAKADGKIIGCTFVEHVEVKIIDYGLAKICQLAKATGSVRPTHSKEVTANTTLQALEGVKKEKERIRQEIIARKTKENPDYEWEYDEELKTGNIDELVKQSQEKNAFLVETSAGVGSAQFFDLQALESIQASGYGRHTVLSKSDNLPKFDVYAAGAIMYCCIMGHQPFRPITPTGNFASKIDMFEAIRKLVAKGPDFSVSTFPEVWPAPSAEAVAFCARLMENDVYKRPSAREALQDPFVKDIDGSRDIIVSEVDCANPHDYKCKLIYNNARQKNYPESRKFPPQKLVRLTKKIVPDYTTSSPSAATAAAGGSGISNEDALAHAAGRRGRAGVKFSGNVKSEEMTASEREHNNEQEAQFEEIKSYAQFDILQVLRDAAEEVGGEDYEGEEKK